MPSVNEWIDRGLEAHQTGCVTEAAIAYEQALAQEPENPDALNLLGVLRHQNGDQAGAIKLISRAIAADPNAADFYANLAEAHRANGAIAPAINAYARSATLDEGNASVWANLAMLLQKTMRFAEAVATWERAVKLEPNSAAYQNNYGLALGHAGYPELAIAPLEQAVNLQAKFPEAIENLTEAFLKAGRLDDAAATARKLVDLRPQDPGAWVFYAAACKDAIHMHDALDASREAIRLEPNRPQAHFVMGQTLALMGESAGAAMAYAKVTELRPEVAGGHANLGLAALAVGRLQDAADALQEATDINPNFAEAWFNLAVVHERMGRFEKAIELSEKARLLRPEWAAVSSMIGNLQLHLGRHAAAEAEFHRALQQDPEYIAALAGLGNVHNERGDHETAAAFVRRAIEIDPHDAVAHSVLLMLMLASERFTPQQVFDRHALYGELFDRSQDAKHSHTRDGSRRLRIGYLSPDLRAHSVAFFIGGVFQYHDHEQFEIVAYDDTARPDFVSSVLRKYSDRWHRVVGMTHDRLTELIREHEIDILVDLTGHTSSNRLAVFAAKPAPIQVSYLGYPATTGLKAIDYRFTDALADPLGLTDSHYTEKLIRLPRSFLAYTPAQTPDVVPLPAIEVGHVMFASFNNSTKLHDGVLALWARVLHAVPGSKITLKANGFADAILRDRVTKVFEKAGIGKDRLLLLAKAPTLMEHLAVYGRCDIALDSFPYNGTTTTCEALWMGVPVLTLAGQTHAARVGVSLLTNIGLTDWIAETPEEFVRIAADMAANLPKLAETRSGMRDRMSKSPIMDAATLTKNIENSYRRIWENWCNGGSGQAGGVIAAG